VACQPPAPSAPPLQIRTYLLRKLGSCPAGEVAERLASEACMPLVDFNARLLKMMAAPLPGAAVSGSRSTLWALGLSIALPNPGCARRHHCTHLSLGNPCMLPMFCVQEVEDLNAQLTGLLQSDEFGAPPLLLAQLHAKKTPAMRS
jgi:hypothetical protein